MKQIGQNKPAQKRLTVTLKTVIAVFVATLFAFSPLNQVATANQNIDGRAAFQDETAAAADVLHGDLLTELLWALLGEDAPDEFDPTLLGIGYTESGAPTKPGAHEAERVRLELLRLITLDLGEIPLPLIKENPEDYGLLQLGSLGLLTSYAEAQNRDFGKSQCEFSAASAGYLTEDGALNLDAYNEVDSGVEPARLDLTSLLGQLNVDDLLNALGNDLLGLGDVLDKAEIAIGAVGSRAESIEGDTTSEYVVAGLDLHLRSPLLGGLSDELNAAVQTVLTPLSDLVSETGGLQDLLAGIKDAVNLLDIGLAKVHLKEDPTIAINNLDTFASGIIDEVLAEPVTSSNGVTVNLSTGDISVNLQQIFDQRYGGINKQDPNTEVISFEVISEITAGITEAVDDITARLVKELERGLKDLEVVVGLNPEIRALAIIGEGLLLAGGPVTVTGTLGGFVDNTYPQPVVDVSGIVVLGGIPLGEILDALVSPLLRAVTPAVGTVLGPALDLVGDALTPAVRGVTDPVLIGLNPIIAGVLPQLVSLQLNHQPHLDPKVGRADIPGDEAFTVRALQIRLLPLLDPLIEILDLGLATSSVKSAKPEISVRKFYEDTVTGERGPLQGAEFQLWRQVHGSGSLEAVGGPRPTDQKGTYTWTNLDSGQYVVEEVSAPRGYKLSEVTSQAVDTTNCALSREVEFSNPRILGEVSWEKVSDKGTHLAGSEWTLTLDDPDGDAPIVVTDNDGDESYTGLDTDPRPGYIQVEDLAWGEYTLTETKAPTGYQIAPDEAARTFIVDEDTVADDTNQPQIQSLGQIKNTQVKGALTWLKTDADNNTLLGGSEWELTPVDDGRDPIVVTDNTGDESYDGKDKDPAVGQFKLEDLAWGEYTLNETKAPAGYELSTEEHLVTIDENEQTIDLGAINNERIPGTVTWNKTDLSGNLLYGSEWKLTPVDVDGGEPIVVTDNTGDESYDGKDQDSAVGQFKLEDLAWGEYELTETQSPPGYVLGGPLSFEIGPTSVDVNLGDIENEPHQGLTIPLTGGKSSEFYLFSGAILLIATLGFWLYRARSHKTT